MTISMSIEGFAKTLNKWDTTPVISTVYSGPARTMVAVAQIVMGVIVGIFSVAFGWINGLNDWKNSVKINFKECCHGIGNLVRGLIATCPLAGNLTIYLYEKSPFGPVVLRRGADGLYTMPHLSVPGFSNMGTMKGRELNINAGDFHLDTANGIVPDGWVLER